MTRTLSTRSAQVRPRVVIIENVLNLRTMLHPDTGRPFIKEIAVSLAEAGYGDIAWDVFKMDAHGVPQTRRRFVFVAFRDKAPDRWHLPAPHPEQNDPSRGPHQ